MIPGVRGRSVAVVGRAESLVGAGNGPAIDAADMVVRVNWTLPIDAPAEDVGERTDVVYYCGGCLGQRDAAKQAGAMPVMVDKALRRTLARERSALHWRSYRPTTGVVCIFDALAGGAELVCAYGFDFYRSGYAVDTADWRGGKRPRWTHDPDHDRLMVKPLLTDPRFRPDAAMREALA